MKIEKNGNKYRYRKMLDGQKITLTFDHKPTQQEILTALAEHDFSAVKGSFLLCAQSYIYSKSNVMSPKTVREYKNLLKNSIPVSFKQKSLSQITQTDIQLLINEYSKDHAPKTVRNLHGFISAVLRQFRPNMNIHTTLPQKREFEPYTPSQQDVERILEASRNDKMYHVPFQLGIMGLRRSEICALTMDDIDAETNTLTISKAKVVNSNNKWVIKEPKTTASNRKIYIPDNLINEITENGYIYNGFPNSIGKALTRYQKQLGIPHFRFHDLRHFFASYAHSQGISDADILASGGWKSDYTMRKVYRHEMNAAQAQKQIFDTLI